MLHYYGIIALDLARERAREAEQAARRYQMIREADGARRLADGEHPARLRIAVASSIRAIGTAARALSDAASVVATRIEGRTA